MYRLVLEYSRILSVGEDEVDCEWHTWAVASTTISVAC